MEDPSSAAVPSQASAFDALVAEAVRYRRSLALIGLRDEQVLAGCATGRQRRLLAWSILKVAAGAPLAGLGVTVHILPYSIVRAPARLPNNEGMKATVKVGGCFGLFTLTYLALAGIVGVRKRPWAGLLTFIVAPCSGYVAVLSGERLEAIGGLAWCLPALRRPSGGVLARRARRADLVGQIAVWFAEAGPPS